MGGSRTAWHPAFTILLRERAPRWVEVTAEAQLTAEPLRVDDLITLRAQHPRDPADEGSGLRGIWRALREVMLLELKSLAREFRRGDLHRLIAYGALWCASSAAAPASVTLLLAVPRATRALLREIDEAGLTLDRRDDGYHEVRGCYLRLVVAELRAIAADEGDDLLRWFATRDPPTLATRRWVRQHLRIGSDDMSTEITPDLEGYEEFIATLLAPLTPERRRHILTSDIDGNPIPPEVLFGDLSPEQRLAGLAPEQRLAGLAPEQRLAGLAPEQRLAGLAPDEALLALPDVTLRGLPESYIETLPERVRDAIRARRAR